MILNGLSIGSSDNKYSYNGKELEDDFGLHWYHYGARYYDSQLGRWHVVDPVDEFNSPYVALGNNPVYFIDPEGTDVDVFDPVTGNYIKTYKAHFWNPFSWKYGLFTNYTTWDIEDPNCWIPYVEAKIIPTNLPQLIEWNGKEYWVTPNSNDCIEDVTISTVMLFAPGVSRASSFIREGIEASEFAALDLASNRVASTTKELSEAITYSPNSWNFFRSYIWKAGSGTAEEMSTQYWAWKETIPATMQTRVYGSFSGLRMYYYSHPSGINSFTLGILGETPNNWPGLWGFVINKHITN